MNRLIIIGNGFDMAHGLKTSYMDFINWYWERRLNAMLTEHASISEDCLCKLEIKNTKDCASWSEHLPLRVHNWQEVLGSIPSGSTFPGFHSDEWGESRGGWWATWG